MLNKNPSKYGRVPMIINSNIITEVASSMAQRLYKANAIF